MSAFDTARLADIFGADVVHDEAKRSTSLTHGFGDEPFLKGHFPSFPVVPGVILLDGMILAALRNLEHLTGQPGSDVRSIAIETVAFHRPVLPGMAAIFTARADRPREAGNGFITKCSVMVAGTRHARATMTFRIRGDETPSSHSTKGSIQ